MAIDCAATSPAQDGTYTDLVSPSYAHVDVTGYVIEDQVTGLFWTADAQGTGSFDEAVDACESLDVDGLAGIVGWRLPTRLEMASLFDLGREGTSFPSLFSAGPSTYWTSTVIAPNEGRWTGYFGAGATIGQTDGMMMLGILCVSGALPSGGLELTELTITDQLTRLVWQREAGAPGLNWRDALDYCDALELDGQSDWRVPTSKELLTIVDATKEIDVPLVFDGFDWPGLVQYWTSTPIAGDATLVYAMLAAGTQYNADPMMADFYYTRCVRSLAGN